MTVDTGVHRPGKKWLRRRAGALLHRPVTSGAGDLPIHRVGPMREVHMVGDLVDLVPLQRFSLFRQFTQLRFFAALRQRLLVARRAGVQLRKASKRRILK